MTPAETVAFIRDLAERQEAFAGPAFTQHSDADRQAFLHAAKVLRNLADDIERKCKGVQS